MNRGIGKKTKSAKNSRLIIMTLSILIIFYFLTPREWIHKLNTVKRKQTEIPFMYEQMVQNFSIYDSLAENKEQLLNEIKEINIETEILQEEIISTVNSYCMGNNVIITKISFSEVSPVIFDVEEIIDESNAAIKAGMSIEFMGGFDDVLNLVGDIKADMWDIGFSHLRLLSIDDSNFMGVMDLNFYAIPANMINYQKVNYEMAD